MGSRFDQQIVDAVAATHAALGVDASQGDVRTQVVPLYASAEDRRAFDVAIDALIPGELIRGGFPATPTLQLTPRGWLRSTRRDDVAVLVAAFLETYRAMAAARTLYEKPVTWADLSRSGASDASRGLLNTAGTRFGLFSGGTLAAPTASPDSIVLELPWDVDELIHLANADEFFAYRLANPVERVNFFQRLRLRVTGDLRRIADVIYAASTAGWPVRRLIEVNLRTDASSLTSAIRIGFVRILWADRVDARVSLTYEGLWLATSAASERELIVKALRELAQAFARSPVRDRIPCAELVQQGSMTAQEIDQVLPLLIGQEPLVVTADEKMTPSREMAVGPWLLDLRDVSTFDDLVYTLGRAREESMARQAFGNPIPSEDASMRISNDDLLNEFGGRSTSPPQTNKYLVPLKRAVQATFNEDKWLELGALLDELPRVEGDPRLLRSLRFGDDDYGARVLVVLREIIGDDEEKLAIAADFVDLKAWLAENDPQQYGKLYGEAFAPSSLRASELTEEIGTGGFGRVFRYQDPLLDHPFAVKVLDPTPLANAGEVSMKRFFREAGILFRLNHRGIVRIYDAGWVGGKPYMKMELVDGRNLNRCVQEEGAFAPSRARDIIEQVLEALSHAHGVGVVHRDVKPSNVMLSEDGTVRVIDFGMGIFIEHDLETRFTKTGHAAAATYYTAPELEKHPKLVDARNDLYAVGGIWFYLLVNRPPSGARIEAALRNVPGVGEEYASTVIQALDPVETRYATAEAMLHAVRALRE